MTIAVNWYWQLRRNIIWQFFTSLSPECVVFCMRFTMNNHVLERFPFGPFTFSRSLDEMSFADRLLSRNPIDSTELCNSLHWSTSMTIHPVGRLDKLPIFSTSVSWISIWQRHLFVSHSDSIQLTGISPPMTNCLEWWQIKWLTNDIERQFNKSWRHCVRFNNFDCLSFFSQFWRIDTIGTHFQSKNPTLALRRQKIIESVLCFVMKSKRMKLHNLLWVISFNSVVIKLINFHRKPNCHSPPSTQANMNRLIGSTFWVSDRKMNAFIVLDSRLSMANEEGSSKCQ